MERTKYDEKYIKKLAKKYSTRKIASILGIEIHKLESYLWRHKIKTISYNSLKAHRGKSLPIGTEYIKSDGMALIKISEDKWEYKQRYLYEKYHNIKLPTNKMVIFLDGDKTNFDINNLMAVESREYNSVRNKHALSKNSDLTRLAMMAVRLEYKSKEVRL